MRVYAFYLLLLAASTFVPCAWASKPHHAVAKPANHSHAVPRGKAKAAKAAKSAKPKHSRALERGYTKHGHHTSLARGRKSMPAAEPPQPVLPPIEVHHDRKQRHKTVPATTPEGASAQAV